MKETLTPRQSEVLEFIKVYKEANSYSPSYQEIADQFGLRAVSTAFEHVANLIKKGYLTRTQEFTRSIKLSEESNKPTVKQLLAQAVIVCRNEGRRDDAWKIHLALRNVEQLSPEESNALIEQLTSHQ